ncbi:pur operon repressor, partial [Enterococcus faecium]
IEEFESELVGITLFTESKLNGYRAIEDYTSLLYVKHVDTESKNLTVDTGKYFSE